MARDTNKVVFESMYVTTAEIVAKFTFNLIEEFFYSNFKHSPPLTLLLFWSNVMLLSFGIGLFKKEALPLFFSGLYLLMNGGYKTAYILETPEKINSRKKNPNKGLQCCHAPGHFEPQKINQKKHLKSVVNSIKGRGIGNKHEVVPLRLLRYCKV